MEEVANRIQEIIKEKGITNSEMADSIGLPRPILSHILSGRNKPSLAVVQKIADTYPELDLMWLLVGQKSESHSIDSIKTTLTSFEQPTKKEPQAVVYPKEEKPRETLDQDATKIAKPTNREEIVQIVHYYANGTFKVFRPNA